MSPVHIAAFFILQTDDGAAAPVAHSPILWNQRHHLTWCAIAGPLAIAVLVLLLIASLYSWAVILGKGHTPFAVPDRKAGASCAPSARPAGCKRWGRSANSSSPVRW